MDRNYRPKGWTEDHERRYREYTGWSEKIDLNDPSIEALKKLSSTKYYDKEGHEIDVDMYSILFGEIGYKIVEQTELGDFFVSTVWLGLDHGWPWAHDEKTPYKPLIFETMVFPNEKSKKDKDKIRDWIDLDMERYSTLEEAIAGHKKMVKRYSQFKQTMDSPVLGNRETNRK